MKSTRVEPRKPRWLVLLALVVVLLVTVLAPPVLAQTRNAAAVTQMRLEQSDDAVYLNAAVQFELPALVEDVLDKGIAIYFVAEAEMFQERWYWTDRKVAQATRHMRLAYQPLTRRWRLNVSPLPLSGSASFSLSLNQNFDSLADALEAVRRVGRLRMGDSAEIGDDPLHQVTFRFRLDTSQLPRPFQIGVAGQADWNISAERSARLAVEKQR
ncbi:hypothetical protein APR50_37730 [Variovorax paradoxus]|uniref:DUF4390 domain-containing protein n=1 Tax=Variovorax TaxID=34072 RepID=UPI0006E65FAC|nr:MULTISPECIES: DUF4390 domain-containing protein [unclassified Variovorax]KPU94449.1 hypothetical protein APR50_37730 [Variovorax paradoxus]KPU95617.1 hypothetical protein APR52_17065 [Variovorax paradoxus]KPU95951.1 hypothetical protein APR49_37055 [Variovorax paradoxus]KPV15066.1 hypothetical protein APR51_36170 [Variovorax paradoxus]KPV22613.1 hypothetical protein APR48_36705 [Variovorax paradoxus]